MSGFEIAGVVLGSVPLLISGLEHYRDGIETIKTMVQYEMAIDSILVTVSTNLAIYRQNLEMLVQRFMLTEDLLDELWHNPRSAAWIDKSLDQKLQEQFGSQAEYETYILAVRRLHKRIDKLRKKLELDQNFQPPWVVNQQVDTRLLAKFFSSSQKLRRGFRIGFNNGKYLALADGIEADVNRIKVLTEGARTLEPIRAERRAKESAKYWLGVRDRSKRLFSALSSRWPHACQCHHTHVVSIPLRPDIANAKTLAAEGQLERFRLVFSFEIARDTPPTLVVPWNWKVVEVDPLISNMPTSAILHAKNTATPSITLIRDTTPAPNQAGNTLPPITDLCSTLSKAMRRTQEYLGFIPDDEWCHHVHLIEPQAWLGTDGTTNPELTPVGHILRSEGSLGTKAKFKIAASLASAVLRFHATPWLADKWDLNEVFFVRSNNSNNNTDNKTGIMHVAQDQTYLSRNFNNATTYHSPLPNTTRHGNKRREPVVHNEVIFALGIALLELSYGRPLLDFAEADDLDDNGKADAVAKNLIADRLVLKLDGREPDRFVDVVDRCIRCRFDTPFRSLENPTFLALFFQGVVYPLQQICESVS